MIQETWMPKMSALAYWAKFNFTIIAMINCISHFTIKFTSIITFELTVFDLNRMKSFSIILSLNVLNKSITLSKIVFGLFNFR